MPKVFYRKTRPRFGRQQHLVFFPTEGYKFPEKRPELWKVLDF